MAILNTAHRQVRYVSNDLPRHVLNFCVVGSLVCTANILVTTCVYLCLPVYVRSRICINSQCILCKQLLLCVLCVLILIETLHLNVGNDKSKSFKIKSIRPNNEASDPVLKPQQALQLTPHPMITYRNSVPY